MQSLFNMIDRVRVCGARRCAIGLLTLIVTAGLAHGAPDRIWSGSLSDDWFVAANWIPDDAWPQAGETVAVTNGQVLLTSTTAELASFSITNAKLTFTNWTTALWADTVSIGSGGVVTLPPGFSENEISNRVHFICTDFTLAQGGLIDVDGRGYSPGDLDGPGQGPGAGGGGNAVYASGAGYGGHGGQGSPAVAWGIAYGTPDMPLAPGSSGGKRSGGFGKGGSGGGAVWIDATGSVLIDGTISANGAFSSYDQHAGGGSGGAIFITCAAFGGGTSGILRADGEDAGGSLAGGGGGGRIAIAYDSLIGTPGTLISAARAAFSAYNDVSRASLRWRATSIGSLYFSDTQLLNGIVTARGTTAGLNGSLYFGSTAGWEWPDDLIVTDAYLGVGSNSTWTIAGHMTLAGDGKVAVAPHGWLTVNGNFSLKEGTFLMADAGPTNAIPETYGALIDVGGVLTVMTNAWIHPFAHAVDGGAVRFRAVDVNVMAGGGFNADGRGHGPALGTGAGGSGSNTRGSGGGYGGRGGDGGDAAGPGGAAYGHYGLPVAAGSGGGRRTSFGDDGGYGGGVIWIEASGNVMIDGTVSANGAWIVDPEHGGGGSGGGIFIDCASFSGSGSGMIRADGQDHAYTGTALVTPGGGGGGRIAVWWRVPEPSRIQYLGTGIGALRMDAQQPPYLVIGWNPPSYAGVLSAAAGESRFTYPEDRSSEPGTICFFLLRGTIFKFR